MAKFVASIDQGTTSTRCIIFDHEGHIISLDQKEHKQIFPKPGWVEHNALEIWDNTKSVCNNALHKSGLQKDEIAAIGITNQRETTLLWNRETGEPYFNAIVWQDTRTDAICSELEFNYGEKYFRNKVGLPLATYFSGPKIKWLLDNHPEIVADAKEGKVLFGNMDTWLIWNLTGGIHGGLHVTDVTNASRTLLMNIGSLEWDEEILNILNIPASILPEIKPSSMVYGYSSTVFENIPVSGDLGDQQAALFGQTCFEPGEAKNTYGTGCFMLLNTGLQPINSKNGLLTTLGYQIEGNSPVYCLEGSIAVAGALVQWLRDNLGLISASADVETLARTVPDNGGVFFVPAFSGLFAPYWRSDARGVIAGLTAYANKGHIARSILEATAFQTREVLEAMEQDSGVSLKSLKVDGGMVKNELLMQFQADILNVPVVRPIISETTALGAAYAAGLAVGFWKSTDELKLNWKKDKEWLPAMNEEDRSHQYKYWKKAISRTFDWTK